MFPWQPKHVSVAMNKYATTEKPWKWMFSVQSLRTTAQFNCLPNQCGGGVEYLHCDPASRRRRRKGKSQIWHSKIWSRVARDSDPWKTALARTSRIYKRQTGLSSERVPNKKHDRNCQTVINIWSYWLSLCGGGFEYLHLRPASSRRWWKGNQMPRGITLSLGVINTGTWPSTLGSLELETVKFGKIWMCKST
jgi:hypothetical protein